MWKLYEKMGQGLGHVFACLGEEAIHTGPELQYYPNLLRTKEAP